MNERLTEEERREMRAAAVGYLDAEERSLLDGVERSTHVERDAARHRFLGSTEPHIVLRLLDERDDLVAQLDIQVDLFGEIADLVRAAGYPEGVAAFHAVKALIAERNALEAEVEARHVDMRRDMDPVEVDRVDAPLDALPAEWQELFAELDRRDPCTMEAMAREVKERAKKATDGPWIKWKTGTHGSGQWDVCTVDSEGLAEDDIALRLSEDDAAFCAAARFDVPALADAVLQLVADNRRLRGRLRAATDPAVKARVNQLMAKIPPEAWEAYERLRSRPARVNASTVELGQTYQINGKLAVVDGIMGENWWLTGFDGQRFHCDLEMQIMFGSAVLISGVDTERPDDHEVDPMYGVTPLEVPAESFRGILAGAPRVVGPALSDDEEPSAGDVQAAEMTR